MAEPTIHRAARAGDLETVKALLKDNPSLVSNRDDSGRTPLFHAIVGGKPSVVELLLANNATVREWHRNQSPMHLAARTGNTEVAQLLLAKGADVNADPNDGRAPLHVAAEEGHLGVAGLLLSNGADVHKWLNACFDHPSATPLHLAARRGHVGVVEILLRNKAAVNAQNSEGHSPLHEAVIGGHSEVARLLLANHADVNSKDKRGSTPLHDAFYDRKNQKKLAELLLDNHATVDAEDNEGRTPFKVAVGMAEKETIELLLARGATADVFDAVASGCLEKLKELLNADPSLVKSRNVNHSYRTALHYAAENGDKEAVRMLLDLGADANSATEERVRSSSSGGLAAAWSDEATAKQKSGWTPLHYAAERGHTETVALLVGRGANRNAECGDGRTPMHLAAPKAHIDVLKVLLNKKPMQIAVEAGYTAAIKTLLTKRPNINAKDHRGQTPLRLSSHDNARQWLSRHGARE